MARPVILLRQAIARFSGPLAPIWPNYFLNVGKVMYVVDASNLCQISAAGVLLYTVLVNPLLRKAKVTDENENYIQGINNNN